MNLNKHYEEMWSKSLEKFERNEFQIDPQIDSSDDLRRGVTLLIRPSELVKTEISNFINDLKIIEPHQYYYPSSDIHITVMSIISCYSGFYLGDINIKDYEELIALSLKNLRNEQIKFKGLTASPSCLMLKGFAANNQINLLRDNLRVNFNQTNLNSSLDSRYEIQSIHATIVRFKTEIKNKKAFLELLEKYRDFDFGTFEVEHYEFVFNDWYQKKEFTKILNIFRPL
ncbi:AKAP7-like phosphoesterase domain-containing protein [Pedobacter cryophilus]|uniref:Mutarotase n=1 Tax=Pedobacter cryophilus TaxID=2571271 RepID=A0A4U1BXI9_9SPHI|nr:mutarotase [Pedobacter cryophilus]TKB97061.1 mutarotase [Pedobacter cryophilus]